MSQTLAKPVAIKSAVGSTAPLKVVEEGPDYTSRSVIRPVAGKGLPAGVWQVESWDGSFFGFVTPDGREVAPNDLGNAEFQIVPATPAHAETLRIYLGDFAPGAGGPRYAVA